MQISIDCSFLAHIYLPQQVTLQAVNAFRTITSERHQMVASPALFLEFPSLLRRAVNTRGLNREEAVRIFDAFINLPLERSPDDDALVRRAWELAIRLDQSDVFDTMGYALAERMEGESWTCDARFARAAANVRLPGVRLVA